MKPLLLLLLPLTLMSACRDNNNIFDASGTFEAVETIIPAEGNGVILSLNIDEGQVLDSGQVVGHIDSTQLVLRRKQLYAQIQAVLSRKPNIAKQLAGYQEQLRQAEHELQRVTQLAKADAATPKQVDDATAQVNILKKQIEAVHSSLGTTTTGLQEETGPLYAQIEQVEDQLQRCSIVNPVGGTVLTKYAETHEMAVPGKPLYKIADLSSLTLRAYITGDQLSRIKLGQEVTVLVDDTAGTYKEYPGIITRINDKAEFTPKTIQTKNERANLVYAIKINVPNDGYLKIGMYGELNF